MAENTPEKTEVQKPKSKLPIKTLIILAAIFLLEGGAISVFWAFKGGPKPAEGTDPIEQTEQNVNEGFSEVVLVEGVQIDNYMLGRQRMIVTLEAAAKVETKNKEKLSVIVSEHHKEIRNSIRVMVSSAQPDDIKDPKLQVIKRELKTGIEEIVGEGLIQEILLPVWQTYVTD